MHRHLDFLEFIDGSKEMWNTNTIGQLSTFTYIFLYFSGPFEITEYYTLYSKYITQLIPPKQHFCYKTTREIRGNYCHFKCICWGGLLLHSSPSHHKSLCPGFAFFQFRSISTLHKLFDSFDFFWLHNTGSQPLWTL